jgi:cell division protein FtsQ
VFFAIVTVAGLFSGGHVAAALESVRKDSEAVMVRAGLKVDSILVEGRNQTGSEEITRMLGIKPGDLMAYADIDEARARLEALPWVKFAEVRRVWPNKIQVRLVERRPVALWQLNGVTSVIDRDGLPIPGEMPSRHTDLPLVVGKGAGLVVESLLSLVSSQPDLKLRVKAAVRVGERRWNLQLANGVEVRLPEEGADAALADLVRLDREKHILSRDIKAIDLRFADRYVVKLPPGSPLIAPVRTSGGRET